jgi:HSP20 family protein
MANLIKKPEAPAAAPAEWDPFRMMRDWLRWDPFREMAPAWPAKLERMDFVPTFEVKEGKDAFTFKADVPGVKDEDLEITLTGNRLTIAGKREAEEQQKTDTYYMYERSYGTFARAFTLPEGVDAEHIRTELKAGVLTVVVPKRPEAQPKKIAVTPAADKPRM